MLQAKNNTPNLISISNFSPYNIYATVKSKSKSNWNYDVSINFTKNAVSKNNISYHCSCRDHYNVQGKEKNKICWHITICLLNCIDDTTELLEDNNTSNEVMSADEYEVERIMAKRNMDGKEKYLVKWQGYDMQEATWEYKDNLNNANQCVEYHQNLIHNSRVSYVKRNEAN